MLNQNYLIKLLDGANVEWLPLGDICDVKNGYTPSKSKPELWANGTIPWFRMEDIRKNGRVLNDSLQHVTKEAVKSGKLFPANSIILSTTATIGEHALITEDFLCNDLLTVLSIKKEFKDIINHKYLFYYGYALGELCKKNATPGVFALVGTTKIKTFEIPIPCPENPEKSLKIQAEIVRILDNFTALTAELTAELTARKTQYEHYRDTLLTFKEDEVEWKPLGKSIIRTKGVNITASKMKVIHKDNAPVKIFAGGKTFAFVNFDDIPLENINKEPSIIVKSRGIIEFEYYDKPFSHKNEMWSYHSKDENISIKYIYYFLKTKESYFQRLGSKMQMPQIATPDTDKFLIPIPFPNDPKKSLEEQQRIVDILDKFDTLTNSISDGLPREIKLRQQQYEYYRDMLFNFPKNSEVK